jgi:radical SAM protein
MRAAALAAAPSRVYWELTRACDLACRHCRAVAMPRREPDELTTGECERVLHALAAAERPPHVVFTGGDPLKRPDLLRLVICGAKLGLGVAVAPSATPRLTVDLVRGLADAGVEAMSLSVDGSSAARHDRLRGVLGCFGWTMVTARRIVDAGIPLQINTLVTADTEPDLDDLATLVGKLRATRWSLFFLVAVGRGQALRAPAAWEAELMLRHVAFRSREWPFTVTTTEAPHYRRLLIEELRAQGRSGAEISAMPAARGFGVRDGNGIMFISATGDVTPSGFLPLVAGNVRRADPLEIYREAPLFQALRDVRGFHGRCGGCEFGAVCGGSRARAWATSGDVLGEDPLCAYGLARAA